MGAYTVLTQSSAWTRSCAWWDGVALGRCCPVQAVQQRGPPPRRTKHQERSAAKMQDGAISRSRVLSCTCNLHMQHTPCVCGVRRRAPHTHTPQTLTCAGRQPVRGKTRRACAGLASSSNDQSLHPMQALADSSEQPPPPPRPSCMREPELGEAPLPLLDADALYSY